MHSTFCRLALRPLAAAIGFALYTASAQAQVVETQSVTATASYSVGGSASVPLNDSSIAPDVRYVDVLDFQYSGGSQSGLHTYGGPTEGFGSRSSGYGVYDVTGAFSIVQSITNNTAAAQRATFNFFIIPGLLQNDIRSNITGSQSVSSGIKFNVKTNGNSVWGSQADLSTTASGTVLNLSGANLYTPAVPSAGGNPTTYTIAGGLFQIDLGVIAAGETISLQYDLQTYAKGNATGNGSFTVPEQTITVPDQVIFVPEQRYTVYDNGSGYGYGGYGGYGGGYGDSHEVVIPEHNELIPGYTYTVGGQTYVDEGSGSHASSGDPFSINGDGSPYYYGYLGAGHLPNIVTFSAVPEPESYALLLAGIAVAGVVVRRRRQPA
ncbi:MAG: PEP-CTERM sorting domain-containing protein [Rubrivivax sp.]|nr:MAG: PEP-CTERM sorting domain-containing protein [Rubrivivax sp.]